MTTADEALLDDLDRLTTGDPQGMLRAVATSAAQVREGLARAGEAGLDRLVEAGRPRAVVVAGMGGSAVAGDVLAALAAPACPVPVVAHRGYGLPGWVGAGDLVIAVSCSGATEETLSATDEALRRRASLLAVGAPDSPLAGRAEQGRAPLVPVRQGMQPRATLWALAVPVVAAAERLGLLTVGEPAYESTAARLEQIASACRVDADAFVNPAKSLALELAGTIPMAWGAGPLAGVAAYRLACQLAENAKHPGISGTLPEANHNQVVTLDGAYGAGAATDDLFRDRVDDPEATRLRLVLLRDLHEHPQVARRADVSRELAEQRGVPVTELTAEGDSPLERLASLVGLIDFATVYLALLQGVDPTPVAAIAELKDRIR